MVPMTPPNSPGEQTDRAPSAAVTGYGWFGCIS